MYVVLMWPDGTMESPRRKDVNIYLSWKNDKRKTVITWVKPSLDLRFLDNNLQPVLTKRDHIFDRGGNKLEVAAAG